MGQAESHGLAATSSLSMAAPGTSSAMTGPSGPSPSPPSAMPRRVDPRWGRVTLEQLRQDEFLTRQLRRIETIASARQAAASVTRTRQRQRDHHGLFVNAVARGRRSRPWVASADGGDPSGARDPTQPDADREEEDAAKLQVFLAAADSVRSQESIERDEDEMLNALCVLGDLEHTERTALLLCHLQSKLHRQCAIRDPVVDLIALRTQILRDVHDAVLLQHHQQRHTETMMVGLELTIRNELAATHDEADDGASSQAVATSLMSSASSQVSMIQKPKDKAANEANMAVQIALELVAGMLDDPTCLTAQGKKAFLVDILELVETLAPLSLVPKRRDHRGSRGLARGRSEACSETMVRSAADARKLVRKLQEFLLVVASRSSSTTDFDIEARTSALNGLVHLASAAGSVRDSLLVVQVLLGVPLNPTAIDVHASAKESLNTRGAYDVPLSHDEHSLSRTPSSTSVPTRSVSARENAQKVADQENDTNSDDGDGPLHNADEREDPNDEDCMDDANTAAAIARVEQKLRQVHKQRVDAVIPKPSAEMCMSGMNGDHVNTQVKRKSVSKGFVHKTLTLTTTTGINMAPSSSLTTIQTGSNIAGIKSSRSKDTEQSHANRPASVQLKRPGSSGYHHAPSRDDSAYAYDDFPVFQQLRVGSVLKELDQYQPSPSRAKTSAGIRGPTDQHGQRGGISCTKNTNAFAEPDTYNTLPGIDDDDDHEVWSCGQNSYGELGHGDTMTRKCFERIEALQGKEIVQVSAGNEHSVALSVDGTAWTCGYNDNGQCGHGVTTRISHMTALPKLGGTETSIAQVHAYNGCEHTILITEDGRAATCGYNYRGQLGHGNTQSEAIPKIMRTLDPGRMVRLVSCSYYHTVLTCECASSSNCTGSTFAVYTFGRNDYGQLGHGDTIDRKVPQCIDAVADQTIVSVACGQYHTLLVTSTGEMLACGKNDYGQLGIDVADQQSTPMHVPLENQTCLEVRCGYYHSVVLCAGAHLFGFGRNDYGQLGLGRASNTVAVNRQLQQQQQRFAAPQRIEDLEGKDIVRFACGCYHTIAVSDNGIMYAFGRNNHGQLGTGDTNERLYPFPIDVFVGKRIAMVAAGFYHTLVLTGGKEIEEDTDGSDDKMVGTDENNGGTEGFGSIPGQHDGRLFGTPGGDAIVTSAGILADPVVRAFIESTRHAEPNTYNDVASASSSSNAPVIPIPDTDRLSCIDPSCDTDGEDGRNEDQSLRVIKPAFKNRMDTDPSLAKLQSSCPVGSGVHSIELAIIILAQLDRLCKPFVPKRGVYPAVQQANVPAVQRILQLSRETDASRGECDLSDLFDGCFEVHAIHVTSATFNSLTGLIKRLIRKNITVLAQSHLNQSTQAPLPSTNFASTVNGLALQRYALSACLRVLRGNLVQLIRSGLGSVILALGRTNRESPSFLLSTDSSPFLIELNKLQHSLEIVRDAMLVLVDAKNVEIDEMWTSHITTAGIVADAIEVLMVGYELFFPSRCFQARFFLHLITDPKVASSAPLGSDSCHARDVLPTFSAEARSLLVHSIMRRMAEDSYMVKLVPLANVTTRTATNALGRGPSPSTSQICIDHSLLTIVRELYTSLLVRVNREFLQTLGSIHEPKDSSDQSDSGYRTPLSSSMKHLPTGLKCSVPVPNSCSTSTVVVSLLNAIQKHLATAAFGCEQVSAELPPSIQDSSLAPASSTATSPFVARIASAIRTAFYIDPDTAQRHLPQATRSFLDFSNAIILHCIDIIDHTIPTDFLPSPTIRGRKACDDSHRIDESVDPRVMAHLEASSLVGQFLPSLVTTLHSVAQIPVFAVGLLPSLLALLRLLDTLNTKCFDSNEIAMKNCGENSDYLMQHMGTGLSPSPATSRRRNPSAQQSRTKSTSRPSSVSSTTPGEPRVSLSAVLVLPWSLLLEKELAMLCVGMCGTLVRGDPLFGHTYSSKSFGYDEEELTDMIGRNGDYSDDVDGSVPLSGDHWCVSSLFRGGLHTRFLRDGALQLVPTSVSTVCEGDMMAAQWSTTVPHCPLAPTMSPEQAIPALGSEDYFTLMLPPHHIDNCRFWDEDKLLESDLVEPFPTGILAQLTRNSCRQFLFAMGGINEKSNSPLALAAYALCDWLRDCHAKKDASYRMLVRQANMQIKSQGLSHAANTVPIENKMEAAMFASLLHHDASELSALLLALSLPQRLQNCPAKTPPQRLLRLWKHVAIMRRRFVTKRTSIKNSQDNIPAHDKRHGEASSEQASWKQITRLQNQIMDRCRLLLLVTVEDEEEHAVYELDGGFPAPCDPAYSHRACTYAPCPPLPSLCTHVAARFGSTRNPFLSEYPNSRWRLVRILVHVTARWKFVAGIHNGTPAGCSVTADPTTLSSGVGADVFEFVTADDEFVGSMAFIQQTLIDPCRRLSCATRGFELLWETISIVSFDFVHVSALQQVAVVLATASAGTYYPQHHPRHPQRQQPPHRQRDPQTKSAQNQQRGLDTVTGLGAIQNTCMFYREQWQRAQHSLLVAVTTMLVQNTPLQKSLLLMNPPPDFDSEEGFNNVINRGECTQNTDSRENDDTSGAYWLPLSLLHCWGLHFTTEQFEFVNDLGVVNVLQQLLGAPSVPRSTTSEPRYRGNPSFTIDPHVISPVVSSDSIRALPILPTSRRSSKTPVRNPVVANSCTRIHNVVWTLLRFICVHFATKLIGASSPVFPMLTGAFDALYAEARRLNEYILVSHSKGSTDVKLLRLTARDDQDDASNGSGNATLRRSFDLILTPRVFSPTRKGLTIAYDDLLKPPSDLPDRPPMLPLLKPTEFSITFWLFIRDEGYDLKDDHIGKDALARMQQRVLFIRGDSTELTPYMLLISNDNELDDEHAIGVDRHGRQQTWQLEVGVALAQVSCSDSTINGAGEFTSPSTRQPRRLFWERVVSKGAIRTGTWTHVSVVLEGSKLRVYLNGVLDSQRTLPGMHVATWSTVGRADLDFCFGRHCPTSATSVNSPLLAKSTRFSSGMTAPLAALDFLSRLESEPLTTSSIASDVAAKSFPQRLRSFDGVLSHFRFHNRALSPIHVRIVYDERKLVRRDTVSKIPEWSASGEGSSDGDVARVMQLHALLRVLVESAEGRLHLAQANWVTYLWDVFLRSKHLSLQRSSLRILSHILREQPAESAAAMIIGGVKTAMVGDEGYGEAFVRQLLRVIGFSLSVCLPITKGNEDITATLLPNQLAVPLGVHGDDFSVVDANCDTISTKEVPSLDSEMSDAVADALLRSDCRQREHNYAVANELAALIVFLTGRGSSQLCSWREPVIATVSAALAQDCWKSSESPTFAQIGRSIVVDRQLLAMEHIGGLYVLSGAVEVLRSGAKGILAGTTENARIIAVGSRRDVENPPTSDHDAVPSSQSGSIYVSLVEKEGEDISKCNTLSKSHTETVVDWYNKVQAKCNVYQPAMTYNEIGNDTGRGRVPTGETPGFIRLHRDDVRPVGACALATQQNLLSSLDGARFRIVDALIAAVKSADFSTCSASTLNEGLATFTRWQASGLLLKTLGHVVASIRGAVAVLRHPAVLQKLVSVGACDDGNPGFATLRDIERRLYIVRARVHQVLVNLKEEAPDELAAWVHARISPRGGDQIGQSLANTGLVGDHQIREVCESSVGALQIPLTQPESMDNDEIQDMGRTNIELASPRSRQPQQGSIGISLASAQDSAGHGIRSVNVVAFDMMGAEPTRTRYEEEDVHRDGEIGDEEGDEYHDEEDEEEADGDDDEDDDEEDEDDEGDEELEDEDAERDRREFVEELMMMGFPEEWCVLALKQTENDIVSASAWIVDNLEYLSRLQTTLDKQRDQSTESLAYQDEDDDNADEDVVEDMDEQQTDEEGPHVHHEVSYDRNINMTNGSSDVAVSSLARTSTDFFQPDDPVKHIGNVSPLRSPRRMSPGALGVGGANVLINDKETGRKVFGEMYFPFEEGGFASNTTRSVFTAWRATDPFESRQLPGSQGLSDSSNGASTGNPERNNSIDPDASGNSERNHHEKASEKEQAFENHVDSLDLPDLFDQLCVLENAFRIVTARHVILTLCRHAEDKSNRERLDLSALADHPEFITLLKLVLLRGEQMTISCTFSQDVTSGSGDDDGTEASTTIRYPEWVVGHTVRWLMTRHPKFASMMLDVALLELEQAGTTSKYEAVLWTQRELRRSDRAVLSDPSVEFATWLLSALLQDDTISLTFNSPDAPSHLINTDLTCTVLRRLRGTLRSPNLPVKFIAIRAIACILRMHDAQLPTTNADTVNTRDIRDCQLDVASVLVAANTRFSRELVQHRTLYSMYLQVYVDLLLALRRFSAPGSMVTSPSDDVSFMSIPPPMTTSFASPLVARANAKDVDPVPSERQAPPLTFDRKKGRSVLLRISDDACSVAYSGHESWKAVVASRGFTTGVHSWHLRVDKSPSSYLFIGIADDHANLDSFLGVDDHSWGFIGDKALYYQRNRLRVYGDQFGEGDIITVHLDCDQGTLAFSKNGVSLGLAFQNVVGRVFPAVAFYSRNQQVTFVGASTTSETEPEQMENQKSDGNTNPSIQEVVAVGEMMDAMVHKRSQRSDLMRAAAEMTRTWQRGTHRHVVTRTGTSLWVNITPSRCQALGFKAQERVRTLRGNGTVVGEADGRLWVEVDGEQGAWHFHTSKLRRLALVVLPTGPSDPSAGATDSDTTVVDNSTHINEHVDAVTTVDISAETKTDSGVRKLDEFSDTEFELLALDPCWDLSADRQILTVINAHCEGKSVNPWNLSPNDVLDIVNSNDNAEKGGSKVTSDRNRRVLARIGWLRFFNAYLARVIAFFDLTWHYFASSSTTTATYGTLASASPVCSTTIPSVFSTTRLQLCQLISACRGSIFTSIKNDLFTALMDKTAISPRKADDDYDYPDDLPQLLINRPKAATAKCHPGTTQSLLLSMVGQAFSALHFLPRKTLRMVYSHPMDDGQLRSFKVKFEGEGVDDYGGPYREFYSQFFTELQMLDDNTESDAEGVGASGAGSPTSARGCLGCLLPFLMPSPNWRNGVGANREKFVLNGGLLSSSHVGTARVLGCDGARGTPRGRASVSHENGEVKRQLMSEMCYFFGQMLGLCLRTRVCVRLDLAVSVWKQLVGEDTSAASGFDEAATMNALQETDFAAYTLLRTLKQQRDENTRLLATPIVEHGSSESMQQRRRELAEELAAMDLTFTTFLSDGRRVELCPGGTRREVSLSNLDEFVTLVLMARHLEAQDVVNVIKQGLHSVMPVTALALLTWEEVERRMCGVADVDVDLLRQNTEYDEELSEQDECIQRFWRVLGAMGGDDKRAFLRFVWARSRLPVGAAQFHQKFKIQSLVSATGNESAVSGPTSGAYADGQLPKSHTCFFALQLPRYSSDDICRKQMLYAIRNCVEMDGDFRLADTEMTGWADIDPHDQLRF